MTRGNRSELQDRLVMENLRRPEEEFPILNQISPTVNQHAAYAEKVRELEERCRRLEAERDRARESEEQQ